MIPIFPIDSKWLHLALILSGLDVFSQATIEPSLSHAFNKNSCASQAQALELRGVLTDEAVARIHAKCTQRKLIGKTELFEYYACPCQYFHPATPYLLSAASLMKQGVLPFEGGYFDQPAGVMDALSMVSKFLSDYEQKESEKAASKKAAPRRK